jgi:hypothetical protein
MIAVIAVRFAIAKDRVNQIAPPIELQRLETFHFKKGGSIYLSLGGSVLPSAIDEESPGGKRDCITN